jgi:hypothetical protein
MAETIIIGNAIGISVSKTLQWLNFWQKAVKRINVEDVKSNFCIRLGKLVVVVFEGSILRGAVVAKPVRFVP